MSLESSGSGLVVDVASGSNDVEPSLPVSPDGSGNDVGSDRLVGGGSDGLLVVCVVDATVEAESVEGALFVGSSPVVPAGSVAPASLPVSTELQAWRVKSDRQAKRTRMGSMRAERIGGCNMGCGPWYGGRMLAYLYAVLAVLGLALTWRYNVEFMRDNGGFSIAEFVGAGLANPAAASLTCDIFVVGLAATVWMFVEARRVGVRHGWVFVALGWTVAMAFAIPLFWAVRERRLSR